MIVDNPVQCAKGVAQLRRMLAEARSRRFRFRSYACYRSRGNERAALVIDTDCAAYCSNPRFRI